ncbi:MAG TPA: hypothetical protein VNI01_10055 [Elusimicrobiota bacterium]|jgi:hypothetical protein|nr:hypothetical protein [Elusimicrobiota bacterium]
MGEPNDAATRATFEAPFDMKMADAKRNEKQLIDKLAAQVTHYIVSSERALFKTLGADERPVLQRPDAGKAFDAAFADFFQTVYGSMCRGEDPKFTQELESMGRPLGHFPFCMLMILAGLCMRVHRRIDRTRLLIESAEVYAESLHAQVEPAARAAARRTASHYHKCTRTDIRKMDPNYVLFAPGEQSDRGCPAQLSKAHRAREGQKGGTE